MGMSFKHDQRPSARRSLSAVAWVLVLAAGALALSGPPARAAPSTDLTPPLNVTATFIGWNWTGLGSPCSGGPGYFVAHFAANVTGGETPYRYSWNFDDGTPNSSVADPSRTFSGKTTAWKVQLTVTDAENASVSNSTPVFPPASACPAVLAPDPPVIFAGFAIAILLVVGLVAVVALIVFRRRPPG